MENDRERASDGQRLRPWLAALILRRPEPVLGRLALTLQRLRALPRGARRRLRRASVSLAGAALLLAMASSPLLVPSAQAATIAVANGEIAVNDNGVCSLIEAIINANNDAQTHDDCATGAGADVIDLPANGAFNFTASYVYDYGDNALPTIGSDITIAGNNATFDLGGVATGARLAHVNATGDLTLNETQVSNGNMDDATFGGGVFRVDGGALTISDSSLFDNGTSSYGGAVFARDDATLTVTGSTLSGNTAFRGGAINGRDSAVSLTDSEVSSNYATRTGGGIQVDGGSLTLDNVQVLYNGWEPGNIGTTGQTDYGGGVLAERDTALSISGGTFYGNYADYGGGGLWAQGVTGATISGTTFAANVGESGAGIQWGAFGDGGAYPAYGSITNSTFSNNQAYDDQYGGGGGAVAVVVGELTMNNVTVSGNSGYAGGGVAVYSNGTLHLNRVLISGNSGTLGAEVFNAGTVTANNFNLFGHSGLTNADAFYGFVPGASDITATSNGAEPTALGNILDTLDDNGGPGSPTLTHALVAGSPALDRGPSADCTAAPVNGVDQRDVARNQNGIGAASANECDVGAYEYVPVPVTSICPAPENELTTILGVGMGSTKKAVLKAKINVPNSADLVALYGQLVGKDMGAPPRRARFQYPNKTFTQFSTPTGTSARYGGIFWYGGPLQPAASVTGRWIMNASTPKKMPRAFLLYATHATLDAYFDTYVVFPDGNTNMVASDPAFAQTQLFTIPIDAPLGPTDVTVQVALVDNDLDTRPIRVTASAGPASATNVSLGPTNGNTLNLITLTLEDVPAETSEVTLELLSGGVEGNPTGDSAAIVGAAVNYACGQ